MENILKLLTLAAFFIWRMYWLVTERRADKEKPKTKERPKFFSSADLTRHGLWIVGIFIVVQYVFNLNILPISAGIEVSLIGFGLVVLGLGICIIARINLDTNWANAWEYQIKKKHTLVTHGIYSYIRHPIYTG